MRAKRVSQKVPESGVLKACLQLLAIEHIFHRRWNSGSAKVDNGDGTERFFRFGNKGDADILAVPNVPCGGRCCPPPEDEDDRILWEQRHCQQSTPHPVWIETKSDSGRQSFDQKMFQKYVEALGHTYLLVRDVRTVQDWLKEHGAKGLNPMEIEV